MAKNNNWNQCRQNLEDLAESSHDSMVLLTSTLEKLGVLMATLKNYQNS